MTGINIILIGFMGSGKTHWGKIWSERHQWEFSDLDQEIEKEEGLTISEIFEKYGEAQFREMESAQLKKFQGKGNFLLSSGGGAPCFGDNMELMGIMGTVIYLKATPQYILDRIMEEREKRPLLNKVNPAELLFFITNKLKERAPFYEKAHTILDAEQLKEDSLENILIKLTEEHIRKNTPSPSPQHCGDHTYVRKIQPDQRFLKNKNDA